MDEVRATGCLLALDDFGAGHSNFDRVWNIQPDIVKLDMGLVRHVDQSRARQAIAAGASCAVARG